MRGADSTMRRNRIKPTRIVAREQIFSGIRGSQTPS